MTPPVSLRPLCRLEHGPARTTWPNGPGGSGRVAGGLELRGLRLAGVCEPGATCQKQQHKCAHRQVVNRRLQREGHGHKSTRGVCPYQERWERATRAKRTASTTGGRVATVRGPTQHSFPCPPSAVGTGQKRCTARPHRDREAVTQRNRTRHSSARAGVMRGRAIAPNFTSGNGGLDHDSPKATEERRASTRTRGATTGQHREVAATTVTKGVQPVGLGRAPGVGNRGDVDPPL